MRGGYGTVDGLVTQFKISVARSFGLSTRPLIAVKLALQQDSYVHTLSA